MVVLFASFHLEYIDLVLYEGSAVLTYYLEALQGVPASFFIFSLFGVNGEVGVVV